VLLSGQLDPSEPTVERAARQAYELAGIGPQDLDVVEVHDAAAPAELIVYEEIGLAEPGEGPALLRSGATELGGRVPVNPSGGLLSKGHPVGATGCAQVVELVEQLRGHAGERQVQGAKVALAENAGGFLATEPAAVAIHVLAR
jgi:acetyl-CoA acetyltransferase